MPGLLLSASVCTALIGSRPFPVYLPHDPDSILPIPLPHSHGSLGVYQLQKVSFGGSVIHAESYGLTASGLVVIFACNICAVVGVPVDLHELVGLLDEDVRMVMAGVPVENRRAFGIHVR